MNGETIAMIKALQVKSIEELKTSGGSSDAGKVLTVGGDGRIAPIDLPVGEGEIALDGTLTIAGAAAGAKETGDAIRSLNGSLDQQQETLDVAFGSAAVSEKTVEKALLVQGEQVKADTGEFVPRPAGARTDYLSCWNYVKIKSSATTRLAAFYDKNKEYVKRADLLADTYIDVPENAEYIVVSGTIAGLTDLTLTAIAKSINYMLDSVKTSFDGKIDDLRNTFNDDINSKISAAQVLVYREPTLKYSVGSITLSSGVNDISTISCRTEYFLIKKQLCVVDIPNDVKLTLRFYHYDYANNKYVYDGGTDWLTDRNTIQNAIDTTESTILRIVFCYADNRDMDGTTDFSHFTGILMYRYNMYEKQEIPFYLNGIITSSSNVNYHKTNNFLIRKGDTVRYSVWMRGGNAAVCAYAPDMTVIYERKGVAGEVINFNEAYTATQDYEYICLTTMKSTHADFVEEGYAFIENRLDQTISEAIKQNNAEKNELPKRKPLAILCAKEARYNDGTRPSVEFYVLADSDNAVYISFDLVEKHKIFTFDGNISRYKFGVRKNNDIIAVYRNEFDTVTAEYGPALDNVRKNPFVFIASENYETQHEVDFGTFNADTQDGLKPTAWLGNVGFCSLPNGDIIFVEYTRAGVVYTANCWMIAATSDITLPSSWVVKKQFLVAQSDSLDLDENYIEHWHAVQHDPYTGTVYVTTGDLDRKSQIFYSTDNGETFERQTFVDPATGNTVISGQKLFRLLNINFTETDVYWSSDSSSEHVVIHCTRSATGGLEPNSIEVLATLPNLPGTPATYGTVYFEEMDALVMMESCDTTYTEMAFRVFDLKSNTVKTMCTIKSATGNNARIGFRTEYTEFDPVDGVIKVGYGNIDRYANKNAICDNIGGNNWANNINNLCIRVFEKSDRSFVAKFNCYYL